MTEGSPALSAIYQYKSFEQLENLYNSNFNLSDESWKNICKHFFAITPTEGQDPKDFFLGELYFQKAAKFAETGNLALAKESFRKALKLNNYNALAKIVSLKISENEYSEAHIYSKKAEEYYLSAGYLLTAKIYYEEAEYYLQTNSIDKAKTCIIQSLIYIDVATALKEDSQIELANLKEKIDDQTISTFIDACMQAVDITASDANFIEEKAQQILLPFKVADEDEEAEKEDERYSNGFRR